MNSVDLINYELEEADGVFTYKNENTTLGFVRFNKKAEVEYILVRRVLDFIDFSSSIHLTLVL